METLTPLYVVSSPLRGGPHADAWPLRRRRYGENRARGAAFLGGALHLRHTGQRHGVLFGLPAAMLLLPESRHQRGNFGREISTRRLADIFLELQEQGAHNINLVTAGHYLPWVCEALDMARPGLHIPVVYNTGGYETPEAVAALRGYVDIWLADVKYRSPELSAEYSNAPDYFEAPHRR